MRHSLLILDDEPLIMESLTRAVPWEELDCYVVGSADNGLAGRQLIDALHPDIIITDIVMPGMTGIELAAHCAARQLDSKVILLSAHADFSYAQKALEYGVSHYVLKPIDLQKLMDAVRQSKDELSAARRKAAQLDALEEMAQSTKDFASSSLLFDIARYGPDIAEQEKSLLLQLNSFPPGVVIAVRLYNTPVAQSGVLPVAQKYCKEFFSSQGYEIVRGSADTKIVFLCPLCADVDMTTAHARLAALLRRMRDEAPGEFGVVVAALSNPYKDFSSLHRRYEECTRLLQRGFFCTTGTVLCGQAEPVETHVSCDATDILHHMRHGNLDAMQEALSLWRTELLRCNSAESALYALRELHRSATLQASQAGMTDKPPMPAQVQNENFDAMLKSLSGYLTAICAYVQRSQNLVGRLQIFIEENYADSGLNLTMLSDALSANSSYLSRLFKKEFGENFSDYLLRVRIERAQYLLRTTMLKNGEIAKQVGFEDDHYFSQVFKKKVQLTPKQYREASPRQGAVETEV